MGEITPYPAIFGGLRPRAPESLSADHDLSQFDCGQKDLNDWLVRRARQSEGRTARTYVVAAGQRVIGYYCLSTGGVYRNTLPKKLQRNSPDEIPIMVLGRLAVISTLHRNGYGAGLLKDAIQRTLTVAELVGARALVVHAIDDSAALFYQNFGFVPSPLTEHTFVLPLETAREALKG